ncbi:MULTISPECIES: primosomal replication protein PriC [Glaesserella]|uniref:Primosomal replication protein N n=1 Tax=Glaesserella australis TaxID=2094024 RepID=A0A328C0A0_9PAST|nr:MULTISPECIES: primosomal replication protein PriC [Glaesserella]AUI65531.1 primosomal replication protein N [Glaesserella sp. 15-184]RAL19729.1 primosomal replication protein N [Glaesserella australis]
MSTFTTQIQQKLMPFLAFSDQKITVSHPSFSLHQGYVKEFIQEILSLCEKIEAQTNSNMLIFQTQKLVEQFDSLKQAIETQLNSAQDKKTFRSSYRFPKNIHQLPYEKRLEEYKKALRALNEKISWLIEQSQQANEADRAFYIAQIEETEYRKKKCIEAIEDLTVKICKSQ